MESPFPSDEERMSNRKAYKIVSDIQCAFMDNGVFFAGDGCSNCDYLESKIRRLKNEIHQLESGVRVYHQAQKNTVDIMSSLFNSLNKGEGMPPDVLDWIECYRDLSNDEE